ncbi:MULTISPECIES: urease accessory protein UreD [unclassified Embleya]|uniref:urease accessory protein UreD n=1 Tax=unclassified Embleya TaxID=2699296 RepID=UPI003407E590
MRTALDRLAPRYYETPRVPGPIAALASVPDTLPVGSPAKVGILDLGFAVRSGRTELVERYQKSPLQLMRPMWFDPHLTDMAYVFVMSTGGGVAQADRYRMDFDCGPDTRVHVTTQSATKVYRMEHDYATQRVHLTARAGSYVEYLPDPIIPFADSRFYQHTDVVVEPGATVLLSETITAGRLARGERHAYRTLAGDLRMRRPDGRLLVVDTLRLEPGTAGVLGPGVFAGHDLVHTLHVVTDRVPPERIADALHTALAGQDLRFGVSTLPHDCGAWLRLLDHCPMRVEAARLASWDAARRLLTGGPAPDLRKS